MGAPAATRRCFAGIYGRHATADDDFDTPRGLINQATQRGKALHRSLAAAPGCAAAQHAADTVGDQRLQCCRRIGRPSNAR